LPKFKAKTMPKPISLLMAMLKRMWELISKPMTDFVPKSKLKSKLKPKPPSPNIFSASNYPLPAVTLLPDNNGKRHPFGRRR
jgi:hypothetical protein